MLSVKKCVFREKIPTANKQKQSKKKKKKKKKVGEMCGRHTPKNFAYTREVLFVTIS